MYHAPRGKGFFLPWLTFHLGLFGEEKLDFRFLFNVSSPRQRCEYSQGIFVLFLGEGMVSLGEGVCLGMGMYAYVSPRTEKWDLLVRPGEVVARLG